MLGSPGSRGHLRTPPSTRRPTADRLTSVSTSVAAHASDADAVASSVPTAGTVVRGLGTAAALRATWLRVALGFSPASSAGACVAARVCSACRRHRYGKDRRRSPSRVRMCHHQNQCRSFHSLHLMRAPCRRSCSCSPRPGTARCAGTAALTRSRRCYARTSLHRSRQRS